MIKPIELKPAPLGQTIEEKLEVIRLKINEIIKEINNDRTKRQ